MKGEGKGFPRFVLCLVVGAAFLTAPLTAHAAVVTPDTTSDEFDMSPNSTCALREAIQTFNNFNNFGGCTHSGGFGTADTIELPTGRYTLTRGPTGSDDNSTGDLNPFVVLTVQPASGGVVTLDGNNTDRILFGGDLTLHRLSLTGGNASDPDPLIGKNGGAIFTSSGSSLTITDSTFSGNTTDSFGGAIDANGPTSLTNVTISGNTSTDHGGGGLAAFGATLALDHVTITDNHSTHDNPAESTVVGGIYAQATTSTIHNSVIAGNTSASTTTHAPDCQGSLTSTGGNVIGDTSGCTITPLPSDAVGDQTTPVNALLGPLDDNGGTTFTHGLLSGSPALERGVATCLSSDQRGYPRPFGASCDSGAYELFLCDGTPLNAPGPFSDCAPPPAANPPVQPAIPPVKRKKCKKKKSHRGAVVAKKRCKKKRRR